MSFDKMPNAEDIVDALIELRDIKRWSNYKVAIECDLPISTVANIFNKKSMPQLETLLAICRGFDIPPAQLFGNKEKYDKLSDKEIEIIKLWGKLDAERQDAIENLIELLGK